MAAVIGALRAELSASIAQFESDMGRAANAVGRFARQAQKVSQQISAAGRSITLGLTAPIGAFAVLAARSAGDFEAAMNRVEAATGAAGKELEALKKQARDFGKDRRFTATAKDAADAMEALAKNGLEVTDILGGAEEATLKLSAATGANFTDSADVATGAMQQFGKTAEQLNNVVDQVTGVLLVSKFGFDDYRLAMGQAGGAAGGLGLTLEDFNTVIAATSNLFASGSDAGTSFKTFLTKLNPTSKEAAVTMKQLGLNFFDAQGRMKSMADIAQMLQDKLGGLADEARSKALTTIFGTDAMRTAIGLMNNGADGLERIAAVIAKASAQKQMEARMKGLNGSIIQLRKQVEALFLAIADSGFLGWVTKIVQGLTTLVGKMAELPKPVLAAATAIAAVAAAIGPLVVGIGWVVGAVANLAPLLPLLGQGLAAVAGVLLGPWGIAIAAAIAAVVLFKDQIIALLGFLAGEVKRLLGPTFQKIMADFQRIWTALTTGPVGAAIQGFIKLLGNLAAILLAVLGEAAIRNIGAGLAILEGVLHALASALEAVSKVLSGDFKGAWESAKEAVTAATGGMLSALEILVPGARDAAMAVFGAVKQWIGDGIASVLNWVNGLFPGLPAAMKAAFETAVGWARNLFMGIKTWIVDNLGPIVKWAIDRINDLKGAFAAIRGEQARTAAAKAGAPAPKAAGAAAPKAPGGRTKMPAGLSNPDIKTFAGGAGGADAAADQIKAATKRYAEAIRDLNDMVAKGLDEKELPKSVAQAEALRRKIDDITQDAKDAGVSINAFAGQIGAMRMEIAKLETAGLSKEAERFALEVAKDQRAVNEFADGGLAPLAEALQEVDDRFAAIRDRIQADIEANRVLAEKNTAAAAAMKTLEGQLLALDAAHAKATEAAKAQAAAESHLADLKAAADMAQTRNQMQDIAQRAGGGFMSEAAIQLQGIERDLAQQRQDAAIKLAEFQAQQDEARRLGDQAAVERLQAQIDLQTQLYDLVSATTGKQIQAQERIAQAFGDFATSISDELSDMIGTWTFDLDGVRGIFKQLAQQMFIKPGTDAISGFMTNAMKGFMGFAHGGSFRVNGMGIDKNMVGIRARTDETVHVTRPGEELGGRGGPMIFNISTPDANSFRLSQRQIARKAKQTMATA